MQACAGCCDLLSCRGSLLVYLHSQGPEMVLISHVHLEKGQLIQVQYFQIKRLTWKFQGNEVT